MNNRTKMTTKTNWFLLCLAVLAAIIIPFLVFGEQLEAWTERMLESGQQHQGLVAILLGGLLASDIFLPVPSSIVSTACGYLLGLTLGALVSSVGMTLSCVMGFYLAYGPGRRLAEKMLGQEEMKKLEHLTTQFGDWMIILARPVPVLAEASVLFAGMAHMKTIRFLLLSTLSNIGISAVYAAIGAYSAQLNSFLLAGVASFLLPYLLISWARRTKHKS